MPLAPSCRIESTLPVFFGVPLASQIPRAELLRNGALVDVTPAALEAGFSLPVAVTKAVWDDAIAWTDEDNRRKGIGNDEDGRRWDVVYMAQNEIRRMGAAASPTDLTYCLYRVPRIGRGRKPRLIQLTIRRSLDDDRRPALTIVQPQEI